jgi:hypothetical protein
VFNPHGLEWSLNSCVLDDGHEATIEPHGSGFHVSLLGERDWETVTLSGTISVPEDVYQDVVPDGERADCDEPQTGLYVTLDCRDAVYRGSRVVAAPAGPGEHDFEIELDRDQLYGTLSLYPSLARCDGYDGDGGRCATETGKRLAEATPGTIAFDLTSATYGLFHPVKRKFSEDSELPPEEHIVHLVLEGKDAPQLFLNADHERLVTALDIRGTRGGEAKVKEVAFDLIETQLWPQLITATARDIQSGGEPSEDWQWDVLRQIAEPLFGPDTSQTEAGRRLRDAVDSPDGVATLEKDIDAFVQSRLASAKKLTALLKHVGGN